MTRTDLERRLIGAANSEQCVAALAQFFAEHELVFGHGTDNADDEAYWLLRHVQQWREDVWNAPPAGDMIAAVVALAVRRAVERKPLAYLLGEAWFAGLKFEVDERVLVPRSPLAETIERGFAPWCELAAGDRVLDIGTGSGCLAIATAVLWPDVRVDATDVSADALAVAADNVALHAVGDRVQLFKADLFPPGGARYRVIMANPPYVPDDEMAGLAPEYASEPALALAGGSTGFDAADRVLHGAGARLESDGVLLLEVGAGADEFAAAHRELPLIWLTFENGGDGVCAISARELEQFLAAR